MTADREHPTTILVLGPMRPVGEGAEMSPRTATLASLLRSILSARGVAEDEAHVAFPDENTFSDIIPGILTMIESADLVVLDLTGDSAGTMYELGLIHALGMPFVLLTSDAARPFYIRVSQCITRFELTPDFDARRSGHDALASRIGQFLDLMRDSPVGGGRLEDFATNAVSAFFDGLPIVDIAAPAGLAAGYWRNAVRRFVGHAGYFDPPDRTFMLKIAGQTVERPLKLAHFVAVKPPSGLDAAQNDDFVALERALAAAGYAYVSGAIRQHYDHDLRDFGVKVLCRVGTDGAVELIDPGIVIDLPTTLYALQHSPRIERIDRGAARGADDRVVQRLRRWRYEHMIQRFDVLMKHHLRNCDNKGHIDKVHFVDIAGLADLLRRIEDR